MREIKFRAKSLDTDDWVWGYYIKNDCDIFEDKIYCPDIHLFADIKKETLGQFTGLKDKNGKEIYEGDVVRFDYYSNGEINEFIIEIQDFWELTPFAKDDISDLEVLGNIYDNPELLKESD